MNNWKQNGTIHPRINGFTLVEALVALMASGLVAVCFVLVLEACVHMVNQDADHQEQFSILQLRQIAALSDHCKVENEWMVCSYMKSDIAVGFDANRLVKIDGYEIFMEDIDYAGFYDQDDHIYLKWEKKGKGYKVQIN